VNSSQFYQKLRMSRIEEAISRSLLALYSNLFTGPIRPGVSNQLGWNHYIRRRSEIGYAGTFLGLLALAHAGKADTPLANQILKTISAMQGEDGGFTAQSTTQLCGKPISLTECTMTATWALATANFENTEVYSNAVQWLLTNKNPDDGWGVFSPRPEILSASDIKSRTLTTARTIIALRQAQVLMHLGSVTGLSQEELSSSITRGMAWLARAQDKSGAWDIFSFCDNLSQSGSPSHTAQAIVALRGEGIYRDCINRGVSWLQSVFNVQAVGGWEPSVEEAEASFTDKMQPYVRPIMQQWSHYSTPWCAIALMVSGISMSSFLVTAAIDYLLDSQNLDGTWLNPLGGEHKPIWAISDNILAFRIYQASIAGYRMEGYPLGLPPLENKFITIPLINEIKRGRRLRLYLYLFIPILIISIIYVFRDALASVVSWFANLDTHEKIGVLSGLLALSAFLFKYTRTMLRKGIEWLSGLTITMRKKRGSKGN
jgi:hypothetical protein